MHVDLKINKSGEHLNCERDISIIKIYFNALVNTITCNKPQQQQTTTATVESIKKDLQKAIDIKINGKSENGSLISSNEKHCHRITTITLQYQNVTKLRML